MELFVILGICFVFYLGYLTGEAVTFFKVRGVFKQLGDAIGVDIIKELTKLNEKYKQGKFETVTVAKLHKLKTEVHGDMIYLFDTEHDDFICQAKTIEELAKLAKDNKQIIGAVVTHNEKIFMFNDGKSEEYTSQ